MPSCLLYLCSFKPLNVVAAYSHLVQGYCVPSCLLSLCIYDLQLQHNHIQYRGIVYLHANFPSASLSPLLLSLHNHIWQRGSRCLHAYFTCVPLNPLICCSILTFSTVYLSCCCSIIIIIIVILLFKTYPPTFQDVDAELQKTSDHLGMPKFSVVAKVDLPPGTEVRGVDGILLPYNQKVQVKWFLTYAKDFKRFSQISHL